MGGDLVSLRMLVVAAAPSQQDLWQKGAAMASVPIEFVVEGTAATAVAALKDGGVDICVVDAALSDGDKAAVTAAARAAQSSPLLFASVGRGAARPDNVDGALTRPHNANDACKLTEICVRAKFPTRVLIVDDSATTRNIVRKILSASCFALEVHEAPEGAVALEQLGAGRFDMVFLDHNMRGFSGFQTMSEIKRLAPSVSVVLMTSTVSDSTIERVQAWGALAFLRKPFYPADIDAVLERHFGLHTPHA